MAWFCCLHWRDNEVLSGPGAHALFQALRLGRDMVKGFKEVFHLCFVMPDPFSV